MRLMRGAIVSIVAKKVFDEARKPHNQAKIKKFVSDLTDKSRRRGSRPYGGYGRG